jgi:hypothetical protein
MVCLLVVALTLVGASPVLATEDETQHSTPKEEVEETTVAAEADTAPQTGEEVDPAPQEEASAGEGGDGERKRYSFANLVALSVVCQNESDLPDWGDGADATHGGLIEPHDVTEFVTAHYPACDFAPGWSFEWAYPLLPYPSDNAEGSAGDGWNVFGPTGGAGSADATVDVTHVDELLVRVLPQEGFVPFAGETTEPGVSAEFYCAEDIHHYDNLELIRAPKNDTTYFCVAFNAREAGDGSDAGGDGQDGDPDDGSDGGTGDDGEDTGDGGSSDGSDGDSGDTGAGDDAGGGDDTGAGDGGGDDTDTTEQASAADRSGGAGACLNCGGSREEAAPAEVTSGGSGAGATEDGASGSGDAEGGADEPDPAVDLAREVVPAGGSVLPVGAPDTGVRGSFGSLLVLGYALAAGTLLAARSLRRRAL